MANEVLEKVGAVQTWTQGGTYEISIESVTDGGAVQGAKGDFGANWATNFAVMFQIDSGGTGPDLGAPVELWWSFSTHDTAGTDNAGGANITGTDNTTVTDAADLKRQLTLIGMLAMDDAINYFNRAYFPFRNLTRYGSPVVINNCGQTLGSTGTDHIIEFTEIITEIQ